MIPTSTNIFGARSKTFKTRWSVGAGETIHLPLVSDGSYNMLVEWGDGSNEIITDYTSNIHTYTNAGTYDIKINGVCSLWRFGTIATSKDKVIAVLNWGDIGLTDMQSSFQNCINLSYLASYAPNVSNYAWAFAETNVPEVQEHLFSKSTLLVIATGIFYGCESVTDIHEKAFWNCPLITSFSYTFRAVKITSIPASLFIKNTLVTKYDRCFDVVGAGLTGNAPELWNLVPEPLGTNCFTGNTNLTNYANIPNDWKGL